MNHADDEISENAVRWHLASVSDDMDWDGFTAWLEADPRNRSAYDLVSLADRALVEHREALAPNGAPQFATRRWPLYLGGAIAASLLVWFMVPPLSAPAPRTYVTAETGRTIALGDGSQVLLGPRSSLTIAGKGGQQLALQGGAYFTIRHDPARAVAITAGALEVRDMGTRFEVQQNGDAVRIEVAEGEVGVASQALTGTVKLPAGRRMLFDATRKLAMIGSVLPQDVGEWREGRLTYDAAPLSLVAADLGRYAGVSVMVPTALASRRFSGTLSIHDGDTAARDLAQLMGLALSRHGDAYRLEQRSRGA